MKEEKKLNKKNGIHHQQVMNAIYNISIYIRFSSLKLKYESLQRMM